MTKEALKLALEALEWLTTAEPGDEPPISDAITAIREALAEQPAQQEQEPVVWMYQDKSTHQVSFQKYMRAFVDHGATYETPLYTTPPQRKPLTENEIKHLWYEACQTNLELTSQLIVHLARNIEAAHGIKGEA